MKTILSVISLALLLLPACSSKSEPPAQQVKDQVRTALPPYLTLVKIESELIGAGQDGVKVNFKATVTSKENLYLAGGKIDGTPEIALLRPTQAVDAAQVLYGTILARRIVDAWTFSELKFQSGFEQFGSPKGSFGPGALVENSPEAAAELKRRATAAEEAERVRREMVAKQEADRKAQLAIQENEEKLKEERHQQELEAAKKRLLEATVAGTCYVGTLVWEGQRQSIRLTFTGQNGFLLNADASNLDNPGHHQSLIGEFVVKPEKKADSKFQAAYSIQLSADGKRSHKDGQWEFFGRECRLGLNLGESGFEGEAAAAAGPMFGDLKYQVRLKRETQDDRENLIKEKELAAKQRASDDAKHEQEIEKEEDKAKGETKDPVTGELAMNSAFVRNASNQVAKFQLLTETGWEDKTVAPGQTIYLLSNCDLKIRWREAGKLNRIRLLEAHQPHWSSTGVDLDALKSKAPLHTLTIDEAGHYSFACDTQR